MELNYMQIKDFRPGLKNINVVFIVLEVGLPTVTKENREVRTFKVADATACVNASIWDEIGTLLVPGDIVRFTKGYLNQWRNCLTLYSAKGGEIQKIGEFCMVFNEQMNISEPNLFAPVPPSSLVQNSPINGTNNGQQRPPVTSANVANNAGLGQLGQVKSTNNTNSVTRPVNSAPSGSNSNNSDAKRQRGSRGGQHRNRHTRS